MNYKNAFKGIEPMYENNPITMSFKESPQGQTHSQNDGCGEPAHNPMTTEPKEGKCKCCGRYLKSEQYPSEDSGEIIVNYWCENPKCKN